ncbi:MAG: hypothetical protein ACRDZ3_04070 [Acidimicrobiia bacterium]
MAKVTYARVPKLKFRAGKGKGDEAAEPLHVDVVAAGDLAGPASGLGPADHVGVAGTLDHHERTGDDGMRRARWVVTARELVVQRAARRAA